MTEKPDQLTIVLERDELACRLIEAATGLKRPDDRAAEWLDQMKPEMAKQFRKMAEICVKYLVERTTVAQGQQAEIQHVVVPRKPGLN